MKAMIYGAGGGTSSDEVTALKKHVLSPYTTITNDSGDEIVVGTMLDNGAVNRSLKCGESYTIVEGFHNGSGVISADSLASQTGANAAAGDILTGKTAWVNGIKLTGTLPTMAGGTKTPSTSQITVICSGYKMTSNIIIPAFSLPAASIIKKGSTYTLYGKSVTGTWEGYTTSPLTLYSNGTWSNLSAAGGTVIYRDSVLTLLEESNQIRLTNTNRIGSHIGTVNYTGKYVIYRLNSVVNLTNYNYLKVVDEAAVVVYDRIIGVSQSASATSFDRTYTLSAKGTGIVDVSSLSGNYYIYIKFLCTKSYSKDGIVEAKQEVYSKITSIKLSNS